MGSFWLGGTLQPAGSAVECLRTPVVREQYQKKAMPSSLACGLSDNWCATVGNRMLDWMDLWPDTAGLLCSSLSELLRPQLFLKCSAHIVTCEVTHNLPPRPKLVLLYNNKKQSNTEDYNNGRVSVTYTLKNHSGRFICEASNEANTQRIEKENNCSGINLYSMSQLSFPCIAANTKMNE